MPIIPVADYTFAPETGEITFNAYVAQGILLERVMAIINSTHKQLMYTALNEIEASVDGNVLTLVGVDMSEMDSADRLLIKYDDPDYVQVVQSDTPLDYTEDSVATRDADTIPVNLTASGIVAAIPNTIHAVRVNSTGGGTVKLWDNASAASGTVLFGVQTLAAGYHDLGNIVPTNGCYAEITGTIDLTFLKYPYIENEEEV